MKRAIAFCCLLAVATVSVGTEPSHFLVIVNVENPTDSASRSAVSRMFLKRAGEWRKGFKAQPVDQLEASRVREVFSRRILGRAASEVEQYWQSEIFSGRNIPPPKKVSEAEVVSFVAKRPGAIGYVSPSTPLPPQVKVLRIQD